MDASRQVKPVRTALAAFLVGLPFSAAGAEIQLPTWVEPTGGPDSVAAAFDKPIDTRPRTEAPRPMPGVPVASPIPRPEPTDLGQLLAMPTDFDEDDPLRNVTSDGIGMVVTDELKWELRRLEFAAEEARTEHALSRLLHRYKSIRTRHDDATEGEVHEKMDRVASWALDARGRLRASGGDASAAEADFRLALKLNPENHAARHDLAVSLAEAGDDEAALRELTVLLEAKPDDVAARRNRATMRLRLGKVDEAIADCDAAIEAAGDDATELASLYGLRGLALHTAGRLRAAALDLNESIRLAPEIASTHTARGHVFAEGGLYDQAIADYAAALQADPASIEAYRCLAWALATCPDESLRSPETAIEAARRARRLSHRDDPLVLDASAAAHASAGDFDDAVRFQQRVVLTAGESAPDGANERLLLYKAGRPYVAARRSLGR